MAGPFRAKSMWGIEQNVRAAESIALELWRMGAAVICPHTNTRFFDGAAPDSVWLSGDITIMSRCDAVVRAPNWEVSSGAKSEIEHAKNIGLPIFDWPDDGSISKWLNEPEKS